MKKGKLAIFSGLVGGIITGGIIHSNPIFIIMGCLLALYIIFKV